MVEPLRISPAIMLSFIFYTITVSWCNFKLVYIDLDYHPLTVMLFACFFGFACYAFFLCKQHTFGDVPVPCVTVAQFANEVFVQRVGFLVCAVWLFCMMYVSLNLEGGDRPIPDDMFWTSVFICLHAYINAMSCAGIYHQLGRKGIDEPWNVIGMHWSLGIGILVLNAVVMFPNNRGLQLGVSFLFHKDYPFYSFIIATFGALAGAFCATTLNFLQGIRVVTNIVHED